MRENRENIDRVKRLESSGAICGLPLLVWGDLTPRAEIVDCCPECGARMAHQSACGFCPICGYSKCG